MQNDGKLYTYRNKTKPNSILASDQFRKLKSMIPETAQRFAAVALKLADILGKCSVKLV